MDTFIMPAIAAIAADDHSDSAEIAEHSAEIIRCRACTEEATTPVALRQEILATGWAQMSASQRWRHW